MLEKKFWKICGLLQSLFYNKLSFIFNKVIYKFDFKKVFLKTAFKKNKVSGIWPKNEKFMRKTKSSENLV